MSPLAAILLLMAASVQNVYSMSQTLGEGESPPCEMVNPIRIHRGRLFAFNSFPPQPLNSVQEYGYGYFPPEQCTWVFESGGNCSLEFMVGYTFERGDVDCREQYFLVGDETNEQRFCGFRPPTHFLSGGNQLFLAHYQRNGRYKTRSSSIDGQIRCIKRRAPLPPPCPETTCTKFQPYVADSLDLANTEVRLQPSGFTGTSKICEFKAHCDILSYVCSVATGPGGECNNTVTFPKPPNGATTCNTDVTPCKNSGRCSGVGQQHQTGSPVGDEVSHNCTATAEQTCLFGVIVCSTVQPPPP